MKTVFNNQQCAHVWAQQTQSHGHSGSMSFEGPTLYSYKTPIARFYDVVVDMPEGGRAGRAERVCLITSESYSTTTSSKHMPAMRRALPGAAWVFSVPHVLVDEPEKARFVGMGTIGTHAMNLEAMRVRWDAQARNLERRRTLYGDEFGRLRYAAERIDAYAGLFNLPALNQVSVSRARETEIAAYRETARAKRETPAYLAAQARKAEAKEAREAIKAAERVREQATARGEWLECARSYWYGTDETGAAYLRVNAGRVETSQGAHVPMEDAQRIIPFIRRSAARIAAFGSDHWNVDPEHSNENRVGSFRVDVIYANGDIKAGCHFIRATEIEKIAKLIGV